MTSPGMLHGALRFSDHPRARMLAHRHVEGEATRASSRSSRRPTCPASATRARSRRDWRQLVAVRARRPPTSATCSPPSRRRRGTPPARPRRWSRSSTRCSTRSPTRSTRSPTARRRSTTSGNVLSVSRGPARRRRRRARAAAARRHRDLPDAGDRARVPRAGVGARRARRGRRRCTSTRRARASGTTAGRSPRSSACPRSEVRVTQVPTGGAFGAKEDLNVQGHAALLAMAHRRPVLLTLSRARRACASTPSATRCGSSTRPAATSDGHLLGASAPGSSATPARTRASATRCSSARPATPAAPTGAERRRRGDGRLHEQPAVRRDARLRRQPVELRDRGRARPARRAGRHRRLGDALAQRARGRRPCSAPASCSARRRPEGDAARGPRRLPRRAGSPGSRCGVKNTGIGNGVAEYGQAILRPEADGTVTLFHSVDRDGPGRPHGAPADRLRGARAAAGRDPRRRRHRARARDRARRPRRASTVLGGSAVIDAARKLQGGLDGRHARRPRRAGVLRRVHGRLDDTAERRRGAGHALRVRAGRRRSRSSTTRAASRRSSPRTTSARRSTRRSSRARSRAALHMGLGQALSEEFVVEGGVPVDRRRSSRCTSSRRAACRGRVHPRRGAAARGPVRREGRRRGGARPDRRRRRRGAVRVRRRPPDAPADEGLPGRAAPPCRTSSEPRMSTVPRRDGRHVARPAVTSPRPPADLRRGSTAAASPGGARRGRDPARLRRRLVVPGNVCAHTHLYSALARGMPYALEPPRELPPDPAARLVAARPRARRGLACARRRSSAAWRRSSPGRRRSSTTTRRRTRSTARST